MTARRQWLAGGAVAALAAAGGLALALRRSGGDEAAALWALKLPRPEGGELDLASLRGKPLVVNFWATWCVPCLRELPALDRFHREHRDKGWQVVGLAIDGPTPVREFLAQRPIGFPVALAGLEGTELLRTLGNTQGALPFSVVIGADGRLRHRKLGETHFEELVGWAREA